MESDTPADKNLEREIAKRIAQVLVWQTDLIMGVRPLPEAEQEPNKNL